MRDADVRKAVIDRLNSRYSEDADTKVIEEMGIWAGAARIDVAVVNGELTGYELKSDRDSLDRLENQASYYELVFDKLSIVVGSRHISKASGSLPRWWGIIEAKSVDGKIALTDKRKAKRNPRQDPFVISQLLWKEEALRILEKNDLSKGWKSKSVREIHKRLASELPIDTLNAEVRTILKARQGWLRNSIGNQRNVSI